MRLLPWPRLVAAQFMLTVKSGRWTELLAGAVAFQAIALLVGSLVVRVVPRDLEQSVLTVWTFGLSILAVVWPALLWRDETPSQRRYHWSLPAARGPHDLARVAAGAIWVLIMTAYVVAVTAIWLPLAHPAIAPWAGQLALSLLALYALGSIAALTTEHPTAWIFVALAAAAGIAAGVIASNWYDYRYLRSIPFELTLGEVGLLSLFADAANNRHKAGLLWLAVSVVGLAIVTLRRGAFRLAVQRAR